MKMEKLSLLALAEYFTIYIVNYFTFAADKYFTKSTCTAQKYLLYLNRTNKRNRGAVL